MEQEINSCANNEIRNATFSGKKSYPTFTKLIGVSKEGTIWFISRSCSGSNNDINLANFAENNLKSLLSAEEKIAADQGFKGLDQLSTLTHIQHPNSREEEIFNREFKRYRVVVEISINQIRKWKICYHKFHSKLLNLEYALQEHHFIVEIVAGLVNKFVMPIRKYSKI